MASTIQIKNGTGSAVPSSLLQGELALNVDSGKLFYGTSGSSNAVSSSFVFDKLTVSEATITQLTSSIVSSSIVFSSGSNIFGDATGDTHTFNGDITASNDISASGIITAEHFESSDDITAAGTIQAEQLTSTDDASIAGDLVLGDNILHSGNVTTKIAFTTNNIRLTAGNVNNVDFRTEGPLFNAPVTSSVDISGSLAGTISAGSGSYHILQGDTSQPTALSIDGHITASGNISASSTSLITAQDLTLDRALTVGGDINANGNIVGDDSTDITNIETIECDNIVHDGDTDTKIAFGTDSITLTAGNVDMITLDENSNDIITFGNVQTKFEGNITASGDISGSGILRYGLPGARQDHFVFGRLHVIGSDVTIGDGHISMSGDLLITGSISGSSTSTGSFAHIITSGETIEFKDGDTKLGDLKFNSSTGLDVNDSSGNKTKMRVGQVFSDSVVSGQNITASGNIQAAGNISSSAGTVITSKLSGRATGDQSGSLYLSGSLTFQSNEAIPAVSASTLYDNNGHLFYGGGLIGGYHLSASAAGNAPTIGYLKLMPHEVLVNDDVPTSGGPIAEDNGDSVGVASNSQELYVYKDIPFGWTATAFRTFGNSTDTTRFYVYDITDTTATADSNTGTLNGNEITLASPVTSTATNYVGIHINVNSVSDNFYGGYIKIEKQ
tara:strand:- start:942 stop:2960 length:2019 start_codon:yes stop_codon:yes gene_type:complete